MNYIALKILGFMYFDILQTQILTTLHTDRSGKCEMKATGSESLTFICSGGGHRR